MDRSQGLGTANQAYARCSAVVGLICVVGFAAMTVVSWSGDADSPPFIQLETIEGRVVYGADDPAQTRATFEELVGAR